MLSCLPLDDDDLRRMLREGQKKAYQSDPGNNHEISPSKFVTVYKTDDGKEYFREERVVNVNPLSPEQTEIATFTSRRCETCNEPIKKEWRLAGLVGPCFVCRRETCPQLGCRANTDTNEFLRAEVRRQPVCANCWNSKTILEQLMIHCPSCGQRVRDYVDIKQCAAGWCRGEKICPSCGIQTGSDSLVCNSCHLKYSLLQEELHK